MGNFLWHVCFGIFMFVSNSNCDVKTWQPNTDIACRQNWKYKFSKKNNCVGLTFSKINTATVFVKNLRVKSLILPASGVIQFQDDNSLIEIGIMSKSALNCVVLNPINQSNWGDFNNWKSLENPDNPAVPHANRLPCSHDDVVFPYGMNSSVYYDQYMTFRGKTFKIGQNLYDQSEFKEFLDTPVGKEIFTLSSDNLFSEPESECSIPSPEACELAINNTVKCTTPVSPHGFCEGYQMCGGYILIDGNALDKVKSKLELQEYESSTFVSRVVVDYEEKIQVVFTERHYTGKSLEEIEHFHGILLNDKFLTSQNPKSFESGPYYEEGLFLESTLSIIFGTLFAALILFGILFHTYGSKTEFSLVTLRNRFASSRPIVTYFAKYDNLDSQARIFDGQSMAGSVVSLDKSQDKITKGSRHFDDDDSPSTSTESVVTVAPKEVRKNDTVPNDKEFSNIELSDRKVPSIEVVDDDLLLKDL